MNHLNTQNYVNGIMILVAFMTKHVEDIPHVKHQDLYPGHLIVIMIYVRKNVQHPVGVKINVI